MTHFKASQEFCSWATERNKGDTAKSFNCLRWCDKENNSELPKQSHPLGGSWLHTQWIPFSWKSQSGRISVTCFFRHKQWTTEKLWGLWLCLGHLKNADLLPWEVTQGTEQSEKCKLSNNVDSVNRSQREHSYDTLCCDLMQYYILNIGRQFWKDPKEVVNSCWLWEK